LPIVPALGALAAAAPAVLAPAVATPPRRPASRATDSSRAVGAEADEVAAVQRVGSSDRVDAA
ncbi:MAG: hypothetical protein H0V38_09665, partial [Sporichthyaceae bacterium]|nr:hypothetical protein [Sporichthyaceae bacterium]